MGNLVNQVNSTGVWPFDQKLITGIISRSNDQFEEHMKLAILLNKN